MIDGEEQAIAFWSHQMNKAKKKYSAIERKALTFVAAVQEFNQYLYDQSFTLFTDQNPLTLLGDTVAPLPSEVSHESHVQTREVACNGNVDTMS